MIKLNFKKQNFTIPSIGNKGTNKFIQFRYDDVRFRMSFDLNKITNEKLRDKQFEIYRSEFEFSNILKANLQDENGDFIFEIFQFWDARQDRLSLRKLAHNYNAYHKGLCFGFTTFCFDEYGWLKNENWDRTEVIEFEVKGFHATNKIILRKIKNDMWSYGLYYEISFAGGAFGLSIYSKPFDSYESVYEFALNDILNRITEIASQPNSAQRDIIKTDKI